MTEGKAMSKLHTGERLRAARERLAISRAEAAENAGISRFELRAYEHGRRDVPESVVACLSRLYGVTPGEVVPSRSPSRLHVSDAALVAGESQHALPENATPKQVLDHYLDFIRELRGSPDRDGLPLRDADLEVLASALGDSPKQIERRLVELIHCSKEEAREIRRALLRRRLVVPAAGFLLGILGMGSAAALKAETAGAVISDKAETVQSVQLEVEVPMAPADEPALSADEPVHEPAPEQTTNSAGEPITRSGTGENGDWAEVIPPLVVSSEESAP